MSTKQITPVTAGFESLKQVNEHNAEYWRARDLQPLLGYAQWRRFEQAIERAMVSCEASGNQAAHHFAGAGKPIVGGKGAVQVVDDYPWPSCCARACCKSARPAPCLTASKPKPRWFTNSSPARASGTEWRRLWKPSPTCRTTWTKSAKSS